MIEPYFPYDPNLPPPDEVVIPLAKWDQLKGVISELIDAHNFIREMIEFADRHPDLPPDLQMRIHHWRAHKGF